MDGIKKFSAKGAGIDLGNLAGLEYLGSLVLAANAITTGTLTVAARDILCIGVRVIGYTGGDIASFRFNGDAGSNYWSRYVSCAAGGTTLANNANVSQTLARIFALTVTTGRSAWVTIQNRAATSKGASVAGMSPTGAAGTSAGLEFGGFEWVNTAAQITSVELRTAGGANSLLAGSGFAVFGKNL